MLIQHRGEKPLIPESAYVAPSAVLCGAVVLGERARVLHGAVLTAEDGEVRIGADTVVMENALIRGRAGFPALIGDAVMVGPHAHVNGARVEDEVFVATGASLFPGSIAETGSELRINSVLQVNSRLPRGAAWPPMTPTMDRRVHVPERVTSSSASPMAWSCRAEARVESTRCRWPGWRCGRRPPRSRRGLGTGGIA